jgi:TatD DNase family protein
MEIFDSHAHLYLKEFDRDRDQAFERAEEAGVVRMIHVGIDVPSTRKALELCERKKGKYFASAGYHPHYVKNLTKEQIEELTLLAGKDEVVGFGEIGLDYFRNLSPPEVQRKAFGELLEAAVKVGKPVIIHTRDAFEDTLGMLTDFKDSLKGILMHCFNRTKEEAKSYLDIGAYLSIPGVVTYKNADFLREAVQAADPDRLLIETDSPYLAPLPHKGKRNEPAYLLRLLETLSEVLNISMEETAELTTVNACKFFSIDRG